MKSFFLSLSLLTCLVTTQVMGQTKKKSSVVASSAATSEKSSFDKFSERLKIGYSGAYQGSSLGEWDSFAVDEKGEKTPDYAHNLFNQLSFNYNFGAKMNFVLNPRWTLNTGSTSAHTPQTNSLLVLEDLLAGFQGVVATSNDKKYSLWLRAALRLPTSRSSRESDISFQPDLTGTHTYDFNKTWQVGLTQQVRQWVYEQKATAYRYRIYHAPYVQYAVSDTTRLMAYYENYVENRKRLKSENDLKPNLQDYWQNVMVGVNQDITKDFSVFPFIGYFVDAKDISEEPLRPAWFGAWISYSIK